MNEVIIFLAVFVVANLILFWVIGTISVATSSLIMWGVYPEDRNVNAKRFVRSPLWPIDLVKLCATVAKDAR